MFSAELASWQGARVGAPGDPCPPSLSAGGPFSHTTMPWIALEAWFGMGGAGETWGSQEVLSVCQGVGGRVM